MKNHCLGYQVRAGVRVIMGRSLIALLAPLIIYSGSGLCAVHHVRAPSRNAALFPATGVDGFNVA